MNEHTKQVLKGWKFYSGKLVKTIKLPDVYQYEEVLSCFILGLYTDTENLDLMHHLNHIPNSLFIDKYVLCVLKGSNIYLY